MLAELLTPIANPKLAATFRKALTDIFTTATQVNRPAELTVDLLLHRGPGAYADGLHQCSRFCWCNYSQEVQI